MSKHFQAYIYRLDYRIHQRCNWYPKLTRIAPKMQRQVPTTEYIYLKSTAQSRSRTLIFAANMFSCTVSANHFLSTQSINPCLQNAVTFILQLVGIKPLSLPINTWVLLPFYTVPSIFIAKYKKISLPYHLQYLLIARK